MLEELVLTKLRDDSQVVTVFTTNGFQMKGHIAGFDRHMVAMDIGGAQAFVYKSAISTIKPEAPVGLGVLE